MIRPLLAAAALLLAERGSAQTVSSLYVSGAMVDQTVVTLDASGNASWTYTANFPGVPALVHLPKAVNSSDALICNWTSITQTSASIHCWRTNVLSGLLSGVLGGTTTGLQVSLVARYIPPGPTGSQ